MVYQTYYPWYIDPPTHGILTSLPMVYPAIEPISMVYPAPIHGILTPYPWYFDPPTPGSSTPSTHGILTPLTMEYRHPYP